MDDLLGNRSMRCSILASVQRHTRKSYSIEYKASDNLRYDGQKIHSNYNGWIQNLDKAIKTEIGLL